MEVRLYFCHSKVVYTSNFSYNSEVRKGPGASLEGVAALCWKSRSSFPLPSLRLVASIILCLVN